MVFKYRDENGIKEGTYRDYIGLRSHPSQNANNPTLMHHAKPLVRTVWAAGPRERMDERLSPAFIWLDQIPGLLLINLNSVTIIWGCSK